RLAPDEAGSNPLIVNSSLSNPAGSATAKLAVLEAIALPSISTTVGRSSVWNPVPSQTIIPESPFGAMIVVLPSIVSEELGSSVTRPALMFLNQQKNPSPNAAADVAASVKAVELLKSSVLPISDATIVSAPVMVLVLPLRTARADAAS